MSEYGIGVIVFIGFVISAVLLITSRSRYLKFLEDQVAILQVKIGALEQENFAMSANELCAENTRLRAALAMSERPCVYCSLPAQEWAKCASGFPGCGRADDAMGCPELGARYALDMAEAKLHDITDRLAAHEEGLGDLVVRDIIKILQGEKNELELDGITEETNP